jgi:hypothetical protein
MIQHHGTRDPRDPEYAPCGCHDCRADRKADREANDEADEQKEHEAAVTDADWLNDLEAAPECVWQIEVRRAQAGGWRVSALMWPAAPYCGVAGPTIATALSRLAAKLKGMK